MQARLSCRNQSYQERERHPLLRRPSQPRLIGNLASARRTSHGTKTVPSWNNTSRSFGQRGFSIDVHRTQLSCFQQCATRCQNCGCAITRCRASSGSIEASIFAGSGKRKVRGSNGAALATQVKCKHRDKADEDVDREVHLKNHF